MPFQKAKSGVKNQENWKLTKFIFKSNKVKASSDPKAVSLGSQIMVNAMGKSYGKAILNHAHGNLLDLGCGHVPFYGYYKNLVSDNFCVDWGNSMHKNEFLDLETDLNLPIPLESDIFDTVLLTDVLEHIYKPNELLKEISRMLKKDGKLILGVPFYYWLHETPHDYYRYTEYALKRMLEEQGFELLEIEAYGGPIEILLDIVAKHLAILKPLLMVHNFLSKVLLSIPFVKKISQKGSKKFPLGYCVVGKKK